LSPLILSSFKKIASMIYLLVDQVAVQQPDEYRRPTLVTLIKSATTKKHSVKSARFAGILPTFTHV
ncbi:hypothetical protein, partial [Salmonella enterica]